MYSGEVATSYCLQFLKMTHFFSCFVLTFCILLLSLATAWCGWFSSDEQLDSPIILWWTPFTGEVGNWRTCGENTCFFTENRTYLSNPRTKVVTFYGSSFSSVDLPIPRKPWHEWALLHEESPKNNPSFCYKPLISLFNHTATWSRKSSFPLTLLSLPKLSDITNQKYFLPVAIKNQMLAQENLSPVVYVQSSCDAPSERDSYIKELQKFINIDSYGKCLNNKPLPMHLENPADSMSSEDFLRLMAKYKFTIAFENAIGDDYITEKLWRPITLGSVPIYMGSPSAQDWLPHDNSVISVLDFATPESLAAHLHALNQDDDAYNSMLTHKIKRIVENKELVNSVENRIWSVGHEIEDFNKENFVEAFECYLCSEVYRKKIEEDSEYSVRPRPPVDTTHYNCSSPIHPVTREENTDSWWFGHWSHARAEANVIHRLIERNLNYSADEFHEEVFKEIVKV